MNNGNLPTVAQIQKTNNFHNTLIMVLEVSFPLETQEINKR
jgi:hypothetical protein